MRSFLVCAALVCLAAAHASGQEGGASPSARPDAPSFARREDAPAEAARLLRSPENRERAWGAYLAGAYGLKEHAPLLTELLADPGVASGSWEEALVMQAALDGLIRLDAEVPAEKLLPLYPYAPDEVIILLARLPEKNAVAALTLFEEETTDERWVAVGNLLAEARAKGFAARLLAGLETRATVYVYDSEGEHGYGGGYGSGCGGYRGGSELKPEGFPPVGRYDLTTSGERGAVFLSRGRHAVYYLRIGADGRVGHYSGCEVERNVYRVEYLADLLGTTVEDLGLEARPFHEVVCRDARECRRALVALRNETVRTYVGVLERLVGAELLDPSEASELKPDLTLHLYDERNHKTSPLPDKLGGVKIYLVEGATDGGDAARPAGARQ